MMESPPTLPDLIPARMVNQFTYCERLFYLEWVNREWADNHHTEEGNHVHRRVDQSRTAHQSGSAGATISTSLVVESQDLGLTAVIDLVEDHVDGLSPIDYKKGSPKKGGDGPEAWPSDEAQLAVQAVLLRANGRACEFGYVYYATTKQRVKVEITEELIARTMDIVDRLRVVGGMPEAPPPLVDSRKCPGCSLVGICLPDEVNITSDLSRPPARKMVRDNPARPLHIVEQGALLRKDGERIRVSKGDETLGTERLIDVSSISLYGNVSVSPQLMRELLGRQISVAWFSFGGWFAGMAGGGMGGNVELRRRQYGMEQECALSTAREVVRGKILNCRTILRRNGVGVDQGSLKELKRCAESAGDASSFAELLGVEGNGARLYFAQFPKMIRSRDVEIGLFERRTRRPPRDPVNCLLSFLYALIVRDLTAALGIVGLDPYFGVYHQPRYGRPSLSLDLAEEFRSLVGDSTVLTLLNNGEVNSGHFEQRGTGVALRPSGRRKVIAAYERRLDSSIRHPVFGYSVTYRRAFELQGRLFAGLVMGEFDRYQPLVTR